ncbi:MAG: heavy-metal-associated domain-containing protein [Bacteroidetes bacterium]|nr:heavy-metal-associated domain-containing protein [Bacteroidota bacterium]
MKMLLFIVCLLAFEKAYSQNNENSLPGTVITIQDDEKPQQADSIRPEFITIKYQVFGMNCPGCHRAIEKQINKIPGVKSSKADWVKQEIEIFSDTIISEEDIFERIKKANFTPGEKIK